MAGGDKKKAKVEKIEPKALSAVVVNVPGTIKPAPVN
jgi:hypothetical protein